jgi:hypothetical protein
MPSGTTRAEIRIVLHAYLDECEQKNEDPEYEMPALYRLMKTRMNMDFKRFTWEDDKLRSRFQGQLRGVLNEFAEAGVLVKRTHYRELRFYTPALAAKQDAERKNWQDAQDALQQRIREVTGKIRDLGYAPQVHSFGEVGLGLDDWDLLIDRLWEGKPT